ncbi:MAG TPA: F0F1 ATP synthase subunit delta [Actinophytocola sp.]|uniref:F0F1 ATP synthase subunit delta n=1 Tax=Actinophytocola sp. TaxID=1872138 RepID=UPI002DB5CAEA|nr:F0F1 ATP synthase subunit delta [Actinophytocola sp.]HEU5470023.1 F0F1 ATP synthase subunit delta [Actinophytocola sp.]
MQFASRESMREARERFEELISAGTPDTLRSLADELFAVAGVVDRERTLRRHLADPATSEDKRRRLADTVFGGKVSDAALEILQGLVASRWSAGGDLVDAVETLARLAALAVAERDDAIEDVEDELFRFARVLAAQPRLRDLLADQLQPVDGRLELLDRLLSGKAHPVTLQLLRQVVRLPRGRNLDAVAARLAELAAERRGRSVAVVTAAAPLTAEQEARLTDILSRIYGRAIDVQIELDAGVLGGLVVRVGDERIDGSVAARLAAARQRLSG